MPDDSNRVLIELLGWVGVAVFLVWCISFGIRSAHKHERAHGAGSSSPPLARAGFPVEPADGPGRYKIVGVDRTTKMDTTWHVEAVSRDNAKVKGELEGTVVTSVELQRPPESTPPVPPPTQWPMG